MEKKRIESYAEYKGLTVSGRKAGYIHTNCYMLSADVKERIEAGCLYQMPLKDGILILEDPGYPFYRVYYYLSDTFNSGPVLLDRDAVIELPFGGNLEDDSLRSCEPSLLAKLGFTLGRESILRTGAPDSVLTDPVFLPEGCVVRQAVPEDSEAILRLFHSCFNPLYAFLPDLERLLSGILEGRVFAAFQDGILVGALNSHLGKGFAECDQLAVLPGHRKTGCGKALLAEYHRFYRNEVREFHSWTDIHNTAAMNMYTATGYLPPFTREKERRANEYIFLVKHPDN